MWEDAVVSGSREYWRNTNGKREKTSIRIKQFMNKWLFVMDTFRKNLFLTLKNVFLVSVGLTQRSIFYHGSDSSNHYGFRKHMQIDKPQTNTDTLQVGWSGNSDCFQGTLKVMNQTGACLLLPWLFVSREVGHLQVMLDNKIKCKFFKRATSVSQQCRGRVRQFLVSPWKQFCCHLCHLQHCSIWLCIWLCFLNNVHMLSNWGGCFLYSFVFYCSALRSQGHHN